MCLFTVRERNYFIFTVNVFLECGSKPKNSGSASIYTVRLGLSSMADVFY